MSTIQSLSLTNVRSHKRARFEFATDINAIVGPNGSGKTTIIEALYLLLRGSSFKGTTGEIAQYGTDQFRTELSMHSNSTNHKRSFGYQKVDDAIQKKWRIDDKAYARLPLSARLPVVLFEPDLARLVSGGPERRRQYIDQLAAQLDLEVAIAQNRFERTVKQRNQLLKHLREHQKPANDQLFIWNTQLAHVSEQIITARCKVIEKLQKEISGFYKELGGTDSVMLTYQSTVSTDPGTYASRLLHFLETTVQRDIILGHTGYGPHRDDLEVRLADQPAAMRASRGEVRTVVIALKLLEAQLLSDHFASTDLKPTLLLDDVLSELDLIHQEHVLAGFKNHQVFVTTTDAHALTPGVHTLALG